MNSAPARMGDGRMEGQNGGTDEENPPKHFAAPFQFDFLSIDNFNFLGI